MISRLFPNPRRDGDVTLKFHLHEEAPDVHPCSDRLTSRVTTTPVYNRRRPEKVLDAIWLSSLRGETRWLTNESR